MPRAISNCPCLVAWIVLLSAVVGAQETGTIDRPPTLAAGVAGKLLRKGWVSHRIERKLEEARHLYLRVYDEASDDSAGIDYKVRAAIGLAMLAREQGDVEIARTYLEWAAEAYGASLRWTGSAAQLLRQLTREEDESGLRLLAEMEDRNRVLEARLGQLKDQVVERNDDLRRRDELIRKLEGRQDPRAEDLPEAYKEFRRSRASLMMESMVQDDHSFEASQRWFLEQTLVRMHRAYSSGRYLLASNAAREALKIDPLNSEAQEYERRCVEMLRVVSGSESEDTQRRNLARLGRQFALESMKKNLERGRSLWGKGETQEAIHSLQTVLREYVDCPSAEPLNPDEMAMAHQARNLLDKCHAETAIADATGLDVASTDLESQVERTLGKLDAQIVAEEEMRAYLERWKKINPELAMRHANEMIEDFVRFARGSGAKEEKQAAIRDAMTLLEWFDEELDPDGTRRAQLKEL